MNYELSIRHELHLLYDELEQAKAQYNDILCGELRQEINQLEIELDKIMENNYE